MTPASKSTVVPGWVVVLVLFAGCGGALLASESEVRFYDDDPMMVDLETEDATGAASQEIDLLYEFIENLFMDPGGAAGPALSNNTIDEVPDSNWFTNRIGTRTLTIEDIGRGPNTSNGPKQGTWNVERGKTEGIMPGMRILDSDGGRYFVKFDSPGHRELATGAEVVVTKLFHALGYYVPENYIAYIRREDLVIAEGARKTSDDGRRRPLTPRDLDIILSRAAREPDGSYRVMASKALSGTPVGGFRFHGTRSDDPNDIVPHEDRRELRGLRVFSAWVNHVDCKGSNTLDTVIDSSPGGVIRHNLIDFGSTLGSAGVAPRDAWEGAEFIFSAQETLRYMFTFGLPTRPWMHARYPGLDSVGRFEAETFEPDVWKPRLPNPAFDRARPEDLFWAARRVAAFTDEHIRAAVESGRFSDPQTAAYLTETLIQRRDKIAQAWLNVVNPVIDVTLDASGVLAFDNAAVRAGVASQPAGYRATWFAYDNSTGATEQLGTGSIDPARRSLTLSELPARKGDFVRVDVSPVEPPYAAWTDPLTAHFRRTSDGWRLIGLRRSAP